MVQFSNKKLVDHAISNPRLLSNEQYDNWFEFLLKCSFVSQYFEAECFCKVSELDWSLSQFKKYRSGAGA